MIYSKETIDKVKLAKQYIENRYQNILQKQKQIQNYWHTILSTLDPSQDNIQQITSHIYTKQNIQKRLQRQKDKLQNYKLHTIIGRGAFGQVRLATDIATNQIVAIKRLQKKYLIQKKQIYNAYIERDFMTKVNSKYIVQLKSTFQDEEYLYIVMQYLAGGDLLHLLVQKDIFTQEQTRFYIAEIILAVQEIHKMNYIHRDIKPVNVLIDRNGHIKISDFGLSKFLQLEDYQEKKQNNLTKLDKFKKLTHIRNKLRKFSKVGTPDYISPEVLTQKTYNHSVDLWSVGVIMFECLYGYPPFTHQNSKQVCHRVVNWIDHLSFPDHIKTSTSAKMLMLGLINHREKRLTIAKIKSHPFFNDIDWQQIHKKRAPMIPKIRNQLDSSNFDSFQLKKPWTNLQKSLLLHLDMQEQNQMGENTILIDEQYLCKQDQFQLRIPSERKSVMVGFRFVGYDFQKIPKDPLQQVAENLIIRTSSKKLLNQDILIQNKKFKNRRLKTEQNNQKISKRLQTQGSANQSVKIKVKNKRLTQKTRPSQLTSMNKNLHNFSFLSNEKQNKTKKSQNLKQEKQNNLLSQKIGSLKQLNLKICKKSSEKVKRDKIGQKYILKNKPKRQLTNLIFDFTSS